MPDIRTLLHEAAPRPVLTLDMAAVRARARRASMRRLAAWVAGAGAVIVAGIPVGSGLLVTGGESPAVGAVESVAPTVSTTSTPTPSAAAPPPVAEKRTESASADAPASPASAAPSAPRPGPSREATFSGGAEEYTHATACSVDSEGLSYGRRRVCRFTAVVAGGWNVYQSNPNPRSVTETPYAYVTVRRDGQATTYTTRKVPDPGPSGAHHVEGCADDIIRPGDLVEVAVAQPSRVWMDLRTEIGVGAGLGWGCSDPGP